MTSAEITYDLAMAAADFPQWTGLPERTLILCSHARSGSTLLGEILYGMGGLGLPLEYLHRGFRPRLEKLWATDSLDAYAREMHGRRTDPSGVFSIKLFWQDIEDLARECDPELADLWEARSPGFDARVYERIWRTVAGFFPNPVFVHLRREDKVRRAVSALAADQRGIWRSLPGQDREAAAALSYDYDLISHRIAVADDCHGHWNGLFDALQVSPHRVTYEKLDADMPGTVAELARWLNRADMTLPPVRLRRQSDAETEALALRFLREHAQRAVG